MKNACILARLDE